MLFVLILDECHLKIVSVDVTNMCILLGDSCELLKINFPNMCLSNCYFLQGKHGFLLFNF